MKLITLLLILPLLLGAVRSPSNKATRKRDFLEREHRREEQAWQCGILYALETGELIDPVELFGSAVDETGAPVDETVAAVDETDVELLAIAIYCEAGADSISEETRRMVGDVILNRVEDDRFPDTVEGVLTQRAQYGRFHWTGVVWPARASNAGEAHAVERAREIARSLLQGEHSELYGAGYIWQAEFQQGSDRIQRDGIWFGR